MLSRLSLYVFAGLACLQSICASDTTTSIVFDAPGSIIGGLQGSVAGTGADGTTYIVSGTADPVGLSTGAPFTATVVGDATHISEIIAISTNGVTLSFHEECSLDSAHAGPCTAILGAAISASGFVGTESTSVVATQTLPLQAVAIPTSSAKGPSLNIRTAFTAIPLGLLTLILLFPNF